MKSGVNLNTANYFGKVGVNPMFNQPREPTPARIISDAAEKAMRRHINDLRKRAEAGDQDAIKSLSVFILIAPEKPE